MGITTQGINDVSQLLPNNKMHMTVDEYRAERLKRQEQFKEKNPEPEKPIDSSRVVQESPNQNRDEKPIQMLNAIINAYELNNQKMLEVAINEAKILVGSYGR